MRYVCTQSWRERRWRLFSTDPLLKQGRQVVKPNRIRFDARAREPGYQRGDFVYRAKIIGLFPYEKLKLESEATLLVFPSGGGEMSFELDFSTIP